GLAVFVLPMSGHAFFSDAVHLLRADLHFKGLAAMDQRRVQGLIQIWPRQGDVILEAAGNRLPNLVDYAEGRITVARAVRDDPNGEEVVNLIEASFLPGDFSMQGVQAFDAALDFRGDAVGDELLLDGVLHLVEKLVVPAALVRYFLFQGQEGNRLEVLK